MPFALTEPVEGRTVRVLFDFQAEQDDDLDLTAGDEVLVTWADDSGWWKGTINTNSATPGKEGRFPSNYVELLPDFAADSAVAQLPIELEDKPSNLDSSATKAAWTEPVVGRTVRVIFDYLAEQEDDIDLVVGDEVLVTWADDSGWWKGINPTNIFRKEGRFPSNYVELLPDFAADSAAAKLPIEHKEPALSKDFSATANLPKAAAKLPKAAAKTADEPAARSRRDFSNELEAKASNKNAFLKPTLTKDSSTPKLPVPMVGRTVRALMDYHAPDDLDLTAGDEVLVTSAGMHSGRWFGTNTSTGKEGSFPSGCVEILPQLAVKSAAKK